MRAAGWRLLRWLFSPPSGFSRSLFLSCNPPTSPLSLPLLFCILIASTKGQWQTRDVRRIINILHFGCVSRVGKFMGAHSFVVFKMYSFTFSQWLYSKKKKEGVYSHCWVHELVLLYSGGEVFISFFMLPTGGGQCTRSFAYPSRRLVIFVFCFVCQIKTLVC